MSVGSWYGQSLPKQQLEALIDKKPKLLQLFNIGDFVQELKSFNPKLLDYVSNSPEIIRQAIQYLTVPPSHSDTHDRKYKLPLMAVETIETQTTCVLNSFFKDNKQQGGLFFDLLFGILNENEILPVIAGYFFRVNLCLLNCRFKETTERVYTMSNNLLRLVSHCEHMAITNTLQLYLNLDINKTTTFLTDKINVKMELLNKIIAKIGQEGKAKAINSPCIIQNLTAVLIETIEKYYLIADGKQMMDIICGNTCIDIMMGLLKDKSQIAYPAINFFISLINYYSFSSLNAEEGQNAQLVKKNLERLQSQPMIVSLNGYFPAALDKVLSASSISLHTYRLLELLCHLISISSHNILSTIKQVRFFPTLVHLLFKHQKCNILHMLIQKAFLHIFISERTIYQEYKKHLFCQIDIIELTASRLVEMFPDEKCLKEAQNKGYFGHFMRILKIYSGIQTTDESIVAAIKSKTEVWNKISKMFIKPYETICYKELGSYQDIPEPSPLDFKIKKTTDNIQPQNSYAIEEIKREEEIKNIKTMEDKEGDTSNSPFKNNQKIAEDIFKTPVHALLQTTQESNLPPQPDKLDKSQSFKEYMFKKKVEAENQIRLQRSISTEKKLSANQRTKITSPSPQKKNSWRQADQPSNRFDKNNSAKIPTPKKIMNSSMLIERSNNHIGDSAKASQSMVNLEDLKKIRVIQIEKPAEKKYRRMEEKDKLLLDFLGIAY